MDLKHLRNSLFASTSAFQPGEELPVPEPLPVGVTTTDNTDVVINLVESARLELTEHQYDGGAWIPSSVEMATSYLDEALELLRK